MSSFTDCPILGKLFELCPFMQTVMPHENHVEGFSLIPMGELDGFMRRILTNIPHRKRI